MKNKRKAKQKQAEEQDNGLNHPMMFFRENENNLNFRQDIINKYNDEVVENEGYLMGDTTENIKKRKTQQNL